jgi:hypothetical protein
LTHLLSGKKRITLEFAGLDNNSVAHGISLLLSKQKLLDVDEGKDGSDNGEPSLLSCATGAGW